MLRKVHTLTRLQLCGGKELFWISKLIQLIIQMERRHNLTGNYNKTFQLRRKTRQNCWIGALRIQIKYLNKLHNYSALNNKPGDNQAILWLTEVFVVLKTYCQQYDSSVCTVLHIVYIYSSQQLWSSSHSVISFVGLHPAKQSITRIDLMI